MGSPIHSLEATYIVHATEDVDKIQGAIERVIGAPVRSELEHLEGHFGNAIVRGKVVVAGESTSAAFKSLLAKMSPELFMEVKDNLGTYIDEHSSLFLRLDKQALVSGSLAMGSADPIRIKVKPRPFLAKGRAPAFFRGLMEGI